MRLSRPQSEVPTEVHVFKKTTDRVIQMVTLIEIITVAYMYISDKVVTLGS